MLDLNQLHLPGDVRDKLAELDLELSEGDITQKGYEKKRTKLLTPFLNLNNNELNLLNANASKSEKLPEINHRHSNQHHISRSTESRNSHAQSQASNKNAASNVHYGLYGQASPANSSSNNQQIANQCSNLSSLSSNSTAASVSSHHRSVASNHHHLMNSNSNFSSPQTRANKRAHRRVTRNESRYHSEVRKEAVQQAIAAMKNKPKPALPMPSKRNSNMSNRNKDSRIKYANNHPHLRSSGRQRSNASSNILSHRHHQHLQTSSGHTSGHGTAGDSEEFEFSTDDDYDDDDDEDLIVNGESSSGTPEMNLKKIKNLTISMSNSQAHHRHSNSHMPNSSSEEASSSTASSTQERQLMSKHLKKQQQPLPLPPRVIGMQESHSANNYHRNEYNNKYHKSSSSSNNQQSTQSQLFQSKNNARNAADKNHHLYKSSDCNQTHLNSPITSRINLNNDDDKPPALPQHQQKLISKTKNSNNQSNEEHLLLSFDDERPPERTPKRVHSKKSTSELQPANETSISKIQSHPLTTVEDLISLEPGSNESFISTAANSNSNAIREPQSSTLISSGSSNHSSSINNTSLMSGALDEPLSLNNLNQLNSLQEDNLPPEYDRVYGDHSNAPGQMQSFRGDNQGNRSPSNRSRVSNDTSYSTETGRYKVSAKIQQLLNTLKRPKKRPLDDFYKDDDFDPQYIDPNGPKPEGSIMTPITAEQLSVPSGLPKTLEQALLRYGSATFKATAATVIDTNGKVSSPLSYGKLLSRSKKIAFNLLNKVGQKRSSLASSDSMPLKTGDRVALVFPNNDPVQFICAFYGCLFAGVVPVPVEVPITKRDSDSLQIGFLLGSCKVQYALTSEACFKGLPKTPTGEIHTFKGWPQINWLVCENWSKPPKDWSPPSRISEDSVAYVEYVMDREGSMKGVSVTRNSMISHCKALTNACLYTESDVMVCLLDFKRSEGLYHAVLTSILNGIHVIFIPYSLMKINPSCWLQMISRFKATTAICKSRDLHWGLLSTKDNKDVNLASLRMLLVADGANPWSLSSCDSFIAAFSSKGLKSEALCPNASSAEAMTVSIRRPGRLGIGATGRGVLSMNALSYNVIRVDQENSLTSLTLQDCGHILPGTSAAVIKINGPPYRCKTDEIGEIAISSFANECFYYGLRGMSENQFRTEILNADGTVYGDQKYCRTGLLGFFGPAGLVFICGTRDGLIQIHSQGRKHNADDLIATILAVENVRFVYRGRIAIFSIKVLKDQRICVIAEQRPDCTEEESFQWMSKVLQAIDSIHQVGIYCLALVPPNCLPRTPLGGISVSEIKRRFLEGSLHPANVLMCPHTTVTNLPAPREAPEVGPASVMVGNIVQGNRLAIAQGRELGPANDDPSILLGDKGDDFSVSNKCQYINEILKWRASTTPDHNLFTQLNSKGVEQATLSCMQLHKRAERIANLLMEKGKVNSGDHISLVYPPGIDLVCAFYACLYVGAVPLAIKPPSSTNLANSLQTMKMVVNVSKSTVVLTNSLTIKLIKSKEAIAIVDLTKNWIPILDIEDVTKKKFNALYRAPTSEMIAYLDFSISTTGLLAGVKISHSSATSLCKSMKLACELYPSRHIALCLEPYSGLSFVLWCLSSIYSGHHSILIPPSEVESNPSLWLTTLSQYKVRDTFCSYGIMELCTKELGASINQLKSRGVDLTCVRTCVVVSEERPRVTLTNSFSKLFSSLGLSNRAVSTSFGCRVNVAMCLQGASSPDLQTVYVDQRALRNDRVTIVERGSPHSLCLIESGKLLPGVNVIIANPDTFGHCGDCNLGEIWIQSPFNSSGYVCVGDEESNFANNEKFFAAKTTTGDTTAIYARTGYLGFLRRTESIQADGEQHDAIYVVGALDETIILRGMRYHPIDIENSVLRCHKKISECAIFTWNSLLVVVSELNGSENEALDLVPLTTNVVLEDHQLIVGVVVIVDPHTIENSNGDKQRMLLRDRFLGDNLNPIYVAYNM